MQREQIIQTARNYAKNLKKFGMPFKTVYLFGSYAKGNSRNGSDIDIAVVSSSLQKKYNEGRFLLWKLRRSVDLRIEPHGFTPKTWNDPLDPLVHEIKTTGLKIA